MIFPTVGIQEKITGGMLIVFLIFGFQRLYVDNTLNCIL